MIYSLFQMVLFQSSSLFLYIINRRRRCNSSALCSLPVSVCIQTTSLTDEIILIHLPKVLISHVNETKRESLFNFLLVSIPFNW